MTAGRFFLIAAVSLTSATLVPAVRGQDVVTPQVENAKFAASGVINAPSVPVRSGPGDNYYPTMRLEKGAQVTVVGVKFDWLKILPPDGSFSYVAKQFVEKTGANTGKITRPNVNVRVGSSLTPMKAAIQGQMQANDPVEILGEADEYYKIKPPAGSCLYVNKQYVDAAKVLGPADQVVKTGPAAMAPVGGAVNTTDNNVAIAPSRNNSEQTAPQVATAGNDAGPQGADTSMVPANAAPGSASAANTQTSGAAKTSGAADDGATGSVSSTPTTRNAEVVAAMDAYQQAEKDFLAASDQPLAQQPIADLTQKFQALAQNDKLPTSMRRNAEIRLQALTLRGSAQASLLQTQKDQEAVKQREAELKSQQEQLLARLSSNKVLVYTAMGELRTSSLRLGETPVFRLVDPANGRSLVYIRGGDVALPGLLNQFVGVKGDLVNDPQLSLSIITPTAVEPVDPSKISAAAAQIQPASLRTTEASTTEK